MHAYQQKEESNMHITKITKNKQLQDIKYLNFWEEVQRTKSSTPKPDVLGQRKIPSES